jgi:hypothetical protein
MKGREKAELRASLTHNRGVWRMVAGAVAVEGSRSIAEAWSMLQASISGTIARYDSFTRAFIS